MPQLRSTLRAAGSVWPLNGAAAANAQAAADTAAVDAAHREHAYAQATELAASLERESAGQ